MIVQSQPSEYLEFLEKFEVKRTTDDCFTPPSVYSEVLAWVTEEYALAGRRVVRPFVPGGNYEAFAYQPGDIVVDNPPFSIFSQIMRFYEANGVDFFLFGPALTLFSGNPPTAVITDVTVEYENGAKVATSFSTNLDRVSKIRTAPVLKERLEAAVRQGKLTKTLPKYVYPPECVTAARLGKIATVDFSVPFDQCSSKIGRLESQRLLGKTIFGGGLLISELKAAELKAAELKAAELKAAELKAAELKAAVESVEWGLSEAERDIIRSLSQSQKED